MLNRILLQGRLGSDAELRITPSGVEVATVNLAVDRDRKDANGERKTDWITIVAWRHTAKFLADYCRKGSMVVVDGRLQLRNYTDRDGNKRTAAEVVVESVYPVGSKPSGESTGGPSGNYSAGQAYAQGGGFDELTEDDGELPF